MEPNVTLIGHIATTAIPKILENVEKVTFSWYDYILFSVMLFLSALIGIYFGCFGSKQSTENEYLFGGKQMKVFPISMSLTASHISGITLLAVPAEVYRFGAFYALTPICLVITGFITIYVFLPVFFKLQITSTYEYLERRFDTKCRTLASFLFAINMFLYLPIVIYIPALAFSAASGINVHLITPVVCGVCIFYTTIGGLKAVVWTDTLQFSVTLATLAAVLILGVKSAGGIVAVWDKALLGDRLSIFDFDWDPTKRDSFWSVTIGMTAVWISLTSVNQGCVQKFLALATLREAKQSVVCYMVAMILVKLCSVLTGLIMYSKYSDCDPFSTGAIEKNDQLLPYYVMDVAGKIPGLSGLFIAGVVCAALSTLSAHLNCLAGTVYEDFILKMVSVKSQTKATLTLKFLVVIIGVICTGIVFIIEKFGALFPLQISLSSITNGPLLGLFFLGVLFPKVNRKGAFYGAIIGLLFSTCLVGTAQYYRAKKLINHPPKPVSTDGCENVTITNGNELPEIIWRYGADIENITEFEMKNTNFRDNVEQYTTVSSFIDTTTHRIFTNSNNEKSLSAQNSNEKPFKPFVLFRIATYYQGVVGWIVTMTAAILISCCTKSDGPIHRDVISPVVHFLLPKEKKDYEYYSIQKSVHIVSANSD